MMRRKVKYKTIIRKVTKKNDPYNKEKLKLGSKIRAYPLKGISFEIIDRKEILLSIIKDDNIDGITLYSKNRDLIHAMLEFFESVWKKAEIVR